jgi:hypothetical protein
MPLSTLAHDDAAAAAAAGFDSDDAAVALPRQVTPMCDRTTQSRVGLQRGFVDVIAAPLFRVAAQLLPGMAPLLQQLEDNRRALDRFTDANMLAQVPPPVSSPLVSPVFLIKQAPSPMP